MLKQKRLYEGQRDQLYSQQFNVEQTSFMMENVQDSVQTVQVLLLCTCPWLLSMTAQRLGSGDRLKRAVWSQGSQLSRQIVSGS